MLLLDQSSSMGDAATEQVREGIGIVGGRLQELIGQGVEARWAVVGFGSEALEGGRVLLPLSPIPSGAGDLEELQSAYATNDPNTDYRSGLLGAREQLRGSTAECRLLLWFTDGIFDVGPDGKDPGDAPAVINGVCASESGVADWFQDSNVLSYVILSNDWDINKWERQFTSEGVLEASLSVMQAITGHEDLDEGKIGKKPPAFAKLLEDQEYEVDAACLPYTQGRAEEGEVLLNAGDLDDIFDVLMAEILGDTRATPCPSSGVQLVGGGFLVESNPLPDGLFVEEVKIFNLNGEESTLSIFALPADGSPRQPLRLVDKAIDSSQLKQFAAGWRIAVEGPGDMEICIFFPALEGASSETVDVEWVGGPRSPEASQDTSLFTVDLSEVSIIEKALGEGRSLDGLLVGFGVDDEDWSASWLPGDTTADLTFKPASPGTVQTVDLWIEVKTGPGNSPDRIPLIGTLRPPIEVTPPAGAPTISCGEDETKEVQELGLNGGEVPTEAFVSSIECTVFPPQRDPASVEFGLFEADNDSFDDLGFVFSTSNGIFNVGDTETLRPGDDPLTFRLEIPEALENSTWKTGGTFEVTVTWDRPGKDTYKDKVTVEVPVDLLARSDTGFALLLTLLIAALAVLVSFGLFRFMNSLVKIPKPDGFFARSADIKIVNATTGAPRFEWVDESQLEDASVVKANSPGRDLIADGVTLTRRVPPFFKPWKNMTARAAGFNTIHSSPAAGKSETPGSFSELVLVATNDSPNEAGELDARVVVLHPKPHRPETSRLNGEIDQMVAPLVAQLADKSEPAPTGTPSLGGPSSQTTDGTTPEPPNGPPSSGGGIAPPPKMPPSSGGGGIAPPPKAPSSGGGIAPPPKKPPSSGGGGIAPPPKKPRG